MVRPSRKSFKEVDPEIPDDELQEPSAKTRPVVPKEPDFWMVEEKELPVALAARVHPVGSWRGTRWQERTGSLIRELSMVA